MKTIILLLVLLTAASVVHAQEGDTSWLRYTIEGDEFSVLLPMLPMITATRSPRKRDRVYRDRRQLEAAIDGILYTIEVYENPAPKQMLAEFISETSEDFKCNRDRERTVTVDGYSGIECSPKGKDYPVTAQFFATETHLYRFLVRRRRDVTADVAREFFSSIRLGKDADGIRISDGLSSTAPTTQSQPDERARVLKKPEPSYTKEARANKIAGTVILKVVFTSKGTVENIHVARGLPDGLTERAVEAAKKIKFIPAMKDGHPVSMWMQLEYVFWP